MYISLEHLNPDLVDLPVEIDLDVYHGSTSGFNSEDPSEITINSIKLTKDFSYEENGVTYPLFKGEEIYQIDSKVKEQIYEEYAQRN